MCVRFRFDEAVPEVEKELVSEGKEQRSERLV
jgi:hypothetical protein